MKHSLFSISLILGASFIPFSIMGMYTEWRTVANGQCKHGTMQMSDVSNNDSKPDCLILSHLSSQNPPNTFSDPKHYQYECDSIMKANNGKLPDSFAVTVPAFPSFPYKKIIYAVASENKKDNLISAYQSALVHVGSQQMVTVEKTSLTKMTFTLLKSCKTVDILTHSSIELALSDFVKNNPTALQKITLNFQHQ